MAVRALLTDHYNVILMPPGRRLAKTMG